VLLPFMLLDSGLEAVARDQLQNLTGVATLERQLTCTK
jgi:hypothetical protein